MARYVPDPAQRVTVFLGEAGCGKSELAVQWALTAAERGRDVHFFDLDQTKPLLRSRDAAALLEGAGVTVHFEQQCADAPTQVGGLVPLLLDKNKSVILDVGGNDTGARLIGGYAHLLKSADAWFVVNPYRPWSGTVEHIPERRAEGGAAGPAAFFAEPHAGHRHHGGGILSGRGAGAPAADALCKGGGGGGVGDAAAGGRGPDGAAATAPHTANDRPGDGT